MRHRCVLSQPVGRFVPASEVVLISVGQNHTVVVDDIPTNGLGMAHATLRLVT